MHKQMHYKVVLCFYSMKVTAAVHCGDSTQTQTSLTSTLVSQCNVILKIVQFIWDLIKEQNYTL